MQKTMIQELNKNLRDDELMTFNGYDESIIGYHKDSGRVVYSMQKLIDQIYHEHSIWDPKFTRSDAFDHLAYNFENSKCGPKSPMIIYDVKPEQ